MKTENASKPKMQVFCKLCGKEMGIHFKAGGYWLYKCAYCSFEEIEGNRGFDGGGLYRSEYYKNSKYKDTASLRLENKRRFSLLEKYVKKGEKVADYGCGSGEFVDYAGREYEMYGCDISSAAIDVARERFPKYGDRFFTSENFFEQLSKFDAICMWDVIEHIECPNKLAKRLRGKMNDESVLLLSTPDIGSLHAKVSKAKWPFMTPPEHLSFFSKKSMKYFAKENGFEVCDWSAKGKWVNVGFVIYKFNRVSNIKIPQFIEEAFSKGWLAHLKLYVPTHDIQYVVLRKGKENI